MAKKRTGGISRRHALDDRELAFVRIFSAFGEKNAAEAYRRAFLVPNEEGDWFVPDRKGDPRPDKLMDSRACSKAAVALLKLDHIRGWIEELRSGAGDHARQVMSDAVLFTDDATALKAAEKVLADEDKLSFKDDAEYWAEIMCAIGAEVVVGVTDKGEITVPLKALFPQYSDAEPPTDVLDKTIRTLEAMLNARKEREAAEIHGDVRPQPREGEGKVSPEGRGA